MKWTRNPRQISEHDLSSLRDIIRKFGVVQDVVVNTRTNRVVGGHQRITASGPPEPIDELPVTFMDLSEEEELALNLGLNRIRGDWDDAVLLDLLSGSDAAIRAMAGFTDAEVVLLKRGVSPEVPAGFKDPEAALGEPDHRCPACGFEWNGRATPRTAEKPEGGVGDGKGSGERAAEGGEASVQAGGRKSESSDGSSRRRSR